MNNEGEVRRVDRETKRAALRVGRFAKLILPRLVAQLGAGHERQALDQCAALYERFEGDHAKALREVVRSAG